MLIRLIRVAWDDVKWGLNNGYDPLLCITNGMYGILRMWNGMENIWWMEIWWVTKGSENGEIMEKLSVGFAFAWKLRQLQWYFVIVIIYYLIVACTVYKFYFFRDAIKRNN